MEPQSRSNILINPNLTFDEMEVNTEKAQEYLKANSPFQSFGNLVKVKPTTSLKDSYGNKLLVFDQNSYLNILSQEYEINKDGVKMNSDSTTPQKIKSLAKELEYNIELVCQIEYLVRKTPVECSKKQMQLVVQHFFNVALHQAVTITSTKQLVMNNAPLLHLGLLAESLVAYDEIILESTKDSAVVCNFIAQLCTKAGFKVNLLLIDDTTACNLEPMNRGSAVMEEYGSIGVVTEKADIDSARDAFIQSDGKAPWYLQRIYVQDCIIDQFIQAMKSKASLKGAVKTDYHLTSKEVLAFGNKVFLLDFTGALPVKREENMNIVLIEGYRTSKELLTLLKLHKHMYISLWSSDISEANEIAFGVGAPVVWINDYAVFDGPLEVAEGIYTKIQVECLKPNIETDNKVTLNLEKLLRKCGKDLEKDNMMDENKMLRVLMRKNFVDVSNGSLCIGICEPTAMVWKHIASYIKVDNVNKSEFDACTIYLSSKGLSVPNINWEQFNLSIFTQIKTVWSNFGTIFAN